MPKNNFKVNYPFKSKGSLFFIFYCMALQKTKQKNKTKNPPFFFFKKECTSTPYIPRFVKYLDFHVSLT